MRVDPREMHANAKKAFACILIVFTIIFMYPSIVNAKLKTTENEDGVLFSRSVESMRDLDYQTWQVVAYRQNPLDDLVVLRIVGYPGTFGLDHPTNLLVHSGRRDWDLTDITLANKKLADDPREAAAEFDLTPLLMELNKNRPLRLSLKGVFTELPVPPYLVAEWRSLLEVEGLE